MILEQKFVPSPDHPFFIVPRTPTFSQINDQQCNRDTQEEAGYAENRPCRVCRDCGRRLDPNTSQSGGWRSQVIQQYDAHHKQGTCKREDASQVAARIVKEATERK